MPSLPQDEGREQSDANASQDAGQAKQEEVPGDLPSVGQNHSG